MQNITLIAAIDSHNGLGRNNTLLVHLPTDLMHFKNQTMGKPIVMGRKTFESIGKALPGRQNIVITKNPGGMDGIQYASCVEEAIEACGDAEEIMIIGGAEIYKQFLPLATRLCLTHIYAHYDADVFFPEVDWSEWVCINQQAFDADEKTPVAYSIKMYERINECRCVAHTTEN